jgi:hypothetical protein
MVMLFSETFRPEKNIGQDLSVSIQPQNERANEKASRLWIFDDMVLTETNAALVVIEIDTKKSHLVVSMRAIVKETELLSKDCTGPYLLVKEKS